MSSAEPSARRSLELFTKLRDTTAAFMQRSEQIAREMRAKRYTDDRAREDALAALDVQTTVARQEMEAALAGVRRDMDARFLAREAQITRFRDRVNRDLPAMKQQERERWLGKLQFRHKQAERLMLGEVQRFDSLERSLQESKERLLAQDAKARSILAGHGGLRAMLVRKRKEGDEGVALISMAELPGRVQTLATRPEPIDAHLEELRRMPMLRVFALLSIWWLLLFTTGGAATVWLFSPEQEKVIATGALLGMLVLFVVAYLISAGRAKPVVKEVAGGLAAAVSEYEVIVKSLEGSRTKVLAEAQAAFDQTCTEIDAQRARVDEVADAFEKNLREAVKTRVPAALARHERLKQRKLRGLEVQRSRRLAEIEADAVKRRSSLMERLDAEASLREQSVTKRWESMTAEWNRNMPPLFEAVRELQQEEGTERVEWTEAFVREWIPASQFPQVSRFAGLTLDLREQAATLERDTPLRLPGDPLIHLPLALSFPQQGSLLLETDGTGGANAGTILNHLLFRLLSAMPPGKAVFTIIDPVGLGQNFAGLMHLADHEDSLINRRIWTQREQIEERLAELNEHVEKVIQMYLRNEYATITEYNEKAGSVAEKYHFLVIAGFPAGISETAAARLQSIVSSGARCGVFTLIHWDHRQSMPEGIVSEVLRSNGVNVRWEKNSLSIGGVTLKEGTEAVFDTAPPDAVAVELTNRIGRASLDSNRVQVPFSHITPADGELWKAKTSDELRVAIGRTGATKLQYLAIGKGTRQHALLAGKTGSGKSTLLHVIITNLALNCSPDEVEFYLIDFKKGVEFKCYADAKLPHARVVAIESDREFALSVLQRVDDELKRRGEMFRKLGAQDIAGYQRAGGTEPMPRTLLMIDEFQEFFVEDDSIAQSAALLFDRIVRQGRAFGIHVILGSQTLGGAYTLARTTLGQMVIRIALQCNEADAQLIMDENNPAPRLLSRPGEGIYNDSAGALEGNSPFQVVWLGDEERDRWLAMVTKLAAERGFGSRQPIVFEGNLPTDVRDNSLLTAALQSKPTAQPSQARCWLGLPNAIKGPTEAVFARQSGRHLLVIGQQDEAAATLLGLAMLALGAQHPQDGARFHLIHGMLPDSAEAVFMERIARSLPQGVVVSHGAEAPAIIHELATELRQRGDGGDAGLTHYLVIHGLQRFRKLRNEDDFSFGGDDTPNPGRELNDIICEGPVNGIHLLTSLDTLNSINRFLGRKAVSELGMRVLFQMSASDSASLIDTPKASTLGLHRALFYSEHESRLETFRPFAMPDEAWLAEMTQPRNP